jgi:spermidine synthase
MSPSLRFCLSLSIAAWSGYLSLSQEMLWIRAMAFATAGRPHAFAYVLGFFLVGIAAGSLASERLSAKGRLDPLIFVAGMFAVSALLNHLLLPGVANALLAAGGVGYYAAYAAIALTAAALGGVLPLAADAGRPQGLSESATGRYVSWIYVANIVGSTAGPLVTGFVLLDRFSLTDVQALLTIGGLVPAAILSAVTLRGGLRLVTPVTFVAACAAVMFAHDGDSKAIFHALQFKNEAAKHQPYRHLLENRSGVIASVPEAGKPDVLYGGGIYDGRFNADPRDESNGISRAYMLAALHPRPTKILEIGLASASWTRVLADHADVASIDVVEINPGYPQLIAHYPEIASVLSSPKVTLHVDDGRRWLKNHPDRQFDFILMNTTFHWRSNISALVSREFLQLAKSRLAPGGVLYYNTTGSREIVKTALSEFKHVVSYHTFIAASDAPFTVSDEARRASMRRFARDGRQTFSDGEPAFEHIATRPLIAARLEDYADVGVITDDNMLTEYKRQLIEPTMTWASVFAAANRKH